MAVNRLDDRESASNHLGNYLRDRRTRLDPAALGIAIGRRRTPGLRREEVAQRANISPAWYTWLEQGRGGAPSAEVLSRIAASLVLNPTEREHLFFLALGRAPRPDYQAQSVVSPFLQRFLETMDTTSALIKTPTSDIVAWNRASTLLLGDFGALPPTERNAIKLMFKRNRSFMPEEKWESIAKFAVNMFRADVARAGASAEIAALVEELSADSTQFQTLWADNDVRVSDEDRLFTMNHPVFGAIELEHCRFAVDGRPDLTMVIHTPVDPAVRARIGAMLRAQNE